jgi:hypothetical protein
MKTCLHCIFYAHHKYSPNLDVNIGSCQVSLPPWVSTNLTRGDAGFLVEALDINVEQGVREDDTCVFWRGQ